MPDESITGTILQPNPYAGGRVAPPIVMPTAQPGTGGNSSNGSQGPGENSLIIDDDVSLVGPSTGLNGTPQTNAPYPGGNNQPTNPGSDFTNVVPGMAPGTSGTGQVPPSGNATGWRQSGSDWYYLDPGNGGMVKGWKMIDEYWYYFDLATGIMATGWKKVEELWYYLEPGKGRMLINWQYIDNEWYYLETANGNGQMITGWKQEGETWYFLFPTGTMAHDGWVKVDKKWYYFDASGRMAFSKIITYQEKKYYVGEDGAMVTNTDMPQVTYNGTTYDVAEDGVCTADQSIQNQINDFVLIALNEHISKTRFKEALKKTDKKDKNGNFIYEGDNKTKYGKWYKADGQPWCAMFVSWCAKQAGILNSIVPKYSNCLNEGKDWYVEKERHHEQQSGYEPKRGDVFFQERSGGGHTGIVVAYDRENKFVYTIEGNTNDAVRAYVTLISESKFGKGFGENGGTQYGTLPSDIEFIDKKGVLDRMD